MKYLFYFLLLLLASELHVNYARRLKHIKSLETELKRKSRVQSRRILHRKDEIEKPSNETSSSTNSTKSSESSDTESSSTTDLGTSTDHKTIDEKNDDKNDTIGADKRSHFLPHTHVDLDGVNLKNETEKKDEETHKHRTHATHHDEDLSDVNNSTTYIAKNVTTSNGEKKGLLESGGSKKDGSSKKGMSAIVVIGNRTHRVSGPVVKQLLSELQRQNTDEDYKKGKKVGKEVGQAGDSNGNLKRLHAANEVAEINKLLGKPLTDDRALGLIKNLLLDKVHSHLAKTMDLDQLQEMADQTLVDSQSIAANQGSRGGEPQRGLLGLLKNAQLQQETPCRDLDSKEKCTYLKDMGLCAEAATNPHIKRRCQETCQLCDQCNCADKSGVCSDCQTLPIPPPGASAPATSTVTHLVALPPPPPAVAVPPPPVAGQPPQQIAAIVAAAPAIPPPLPPPASVSVSLSPSLPPPPAPTAACPVPCPPATCPSACAPPLPSVVTPICLPGCGTASTSPCEEPCVPVHSHLTTALPVVRRTTPRYMLDVSEDRTLAPPRVAYVSAETAVVPPTSPPECEVEVIRRPITCPPLLRTTVTPDLVVNIANTASPLRPSTMLPLIAGTRAPVPALAQPAVPAPAAKCTQPMDIGIALDTSAATVAHWPHIQQFCKNLVDKFQLGGNVARIGLITFDTIAKVPVHLDTYHDSNALKLHCNRLVPDPYGRRRTDSALDVARERLFTTARQGIPKMLFLLEHGKINGGDPSINWNQQLIEPSQKLKEMGVNVFAVGATPIAGVDELKTITSTVDDQSHVIPLQGYAQLPAVVNQIAQKACKLAASNTPGIARDLASGRPRDLINPGFRDSDTDICPKCTASKRARLMKLLRKFHA